MGLGVLVLPCTPCLHWKGLVLWGWGTPLPSQPPLHGDNYPGAEHSPRACSTTSARDACTGKRRAPREQGGSRHAAGAAPGPHDARFSHRQAPKNSWELGGWRAASAAPGSEQGAEQPRAGCWLGGSPVGLGSLGLGCRGCGSRGWGAEGWVDSGLLQGLQLSARRDPVRVRIWVGCGVPSGLRGTRRLSGIAGLCGAAPSCPMPRASVWPPAGKTS